MLGLHRTVAWLTVFAVVAAAEACAGPRTSSHEPGAVVPITNVKAVAGTWAGLASRAAGSQEDDWLEMRLKEDGTYEAYSARQVGALTGKGTVTLDGGRMKAVGTHGSAVLTLYDRQGPVLVMDFRDAHGVPYSAELRPKK
jgi:hypothetical protein